MTPSLITVGSGVCGRSGGVFGSVVVEVCSVLKVRGRPDAVVTFAASPGHMADERSHRPAPYTTQPFPWWWQLLYIMTESFPVSEGSPWASGLHASRQPLPSSDSLRLHSGLIVAIGSTSPVSVSRKTTSLLGLLPLTTASLQLGSPSFLHGLQLLLTPAGAACPAQLAAVFALHPIWPLQILFMGFVHITFLSTPRSTPSRAGRLYEHFWPGPVF